MGDLIESLYMATMQDFPDGAGPAEQLIFERHTKEARQMADRLIEGGTDERLRWALQRLHAQIASVEQAVSITRKVALCIDFELTQRAARQEEAEKEAKAEAEYNE